MQCNEITIKVTLLFAIATIILSFINLLKGAFQAFEEVKYQGIAESILHVILLVFIIITIHTDIGIFGIAISYILANLITLAYLYYTLTNNIITPKYEFDRYFCKKITMLSIPFAITGILYSANYFIDIIMLEKLVGNYAAGIYNAVYKLIPVQNLLVSVYSAVIFPVMSKLFKRHEELLILSYEKSVKYLLMLIILFSVLIVIYSPSLIQLIYGFEYEAASTVLPILIWTVSLLFVLAPGTNLLNSSHKEIVVNKIYIFGAIINVA